MQSGKPGHLVEIVTDLQERARLSLWLGKLPGIGDHSPQLEVADPARLAGPDPQTGGIIHRTGDRSEAKSQICV